ncbi:DUF3810 domain-containing protein [Flavobacterium sp. GCM10027622]|uniref:DUF3810 domain-containing protein n=1 Tax=unclassified Flavobacterium TaxID=196869 RepID=UPI00361284CC
MSRKHLLPLFFVVQFILLKILSYFPEFVESNYSNGLYPTISGFLRILLGWVPFSVGDILYAILIVWIIFWLKKNWKTTTLKEKSIAALNLLSIVYFFFHFLWALNYYRLPLSEKMSLKKEYTHEQLVNFTKKLIAKTNEIQFQITQDTAKKVIVPFSQREIFEKSLNGYQKLNKQYSFFNYRLPSQKESLLSYPLTYMGFGGYLNPFTNEAQVNNKIPAYNIPATTCHEMAHQLGYGSESECNFIGFLSSTQNDDLYFKYSGYTYALRYCLSNIGMKDERTFKELLSTLHPGILKNFKESEEHRKKYKTIIDDFFEVIYDNFLKMNQQKDGMESYSKFVDLLVNYYDKKTL